MPLLYDLYVRDDAVILIETGGHHRAEMKIHYQDDHGTAYFLVMHRSENPNTSGDLDHTYEDTWSWGEGDMSSLSRDLVDELKQNLIDDGVEPNFAIAVCGLFIGFSIMLGVIPMTEEAIRILATRIAGAQLPPPPN